MCQTICQAQIGDRVGREMGGGEENACSFKEFNNNDPNNCRLSSTHCTPGPVRCLTRIISHDLYHISEAGTVGLNYR